MIYEIEDEQSDSSVLNKIIRLIVNFNQLRKGSGHTVHVLSYHHSTSLKPIAVTKFLF